MTARARRRVVGEVQAAQGLSERKAIRYTGFPRSTIRYLSKRPPQEELRTRIRTLAGEHPRWGYRMLHRLLRREGWPVNQKRVERLYREDGLGVRRKGRKRRSEAPRPVREALGRVNERWSLDFVSDTLSTGRRFRCFMAMDEFNRECLAAEPEVSFPAEKVIEVLERLRVERGLPEVIITDNGPEFRSHAFDAWAYARGIKLEFIQPGKPVQNAFIESLNATFRNECLNLHWFRSLTDAKQRIESWRAQYNQVRPHSSLGDLTPEEFGFAHPEEQERLPTTSPAVRQ